MATDEKLVGLLYSIADRVESGDTSWDLQVAITTAERMVLKHADIEGLRLLNRIGLLLSHDPSRPSIYRFVDDTVAEMEPLSSAKDSDALRRLAQHYADDR